MGAERGPNYAGVHRPRANTERSAARAVAHRAGSYSQEDSSGPPASAENFPWSPALTG